MQDSIVIGGNFLCGINIGMQLDVYYMEERVAIPQKQRLNEGLKRLLDFLNTMLKRAKRDPLGLATVEQRRLARLGIPDSLDDPAKLVADLEKALAER
ncbi:hypothetical protein H4R35_001346 [Dimargaris xerosporica]|nr:hypothetical protein H4R35_001346 [Dimargaris xerosporica]